MGISEVTQHARELIGTTKEGDYTIAPTRHASELEAQAPALAQVLRMSNVEVVAREYERLDSVALEAQALFQKTASRLNLAVLVTVCLCALLMVVGLIGLPESPPFGGALLITLGVAGVISGGLGAMLQHNLRQQGLFERWMKARADAETHRLRYFERVISAEDSATAHDDRVPLGLLQLEYFRRYQLGVQTNYYLERGKQHRRAADRTSQFSGIAVFVGAVSAGLSGVLAATAGPQLASIAALGVMGAAVALYATTREVISQDSRNSERYSRTYGALTILEEYLDRVRSAVASGNRDAFLQFVEAVHQQLSLEHRQWQEAAQATESGLAHLQAALSEQSGASN